MAGKKKTVFVGMSGGVDSSVAAALLKKQGYNVVGIHLKCWNVDGCADRDAEDARRAAETLGIPFYTLDFEDEYKKRVVEYMVEGYRKGITPNPDVMCNKEIKFGLFLEHALGMGADYVATGHYIKSQISNLKNKKIGYSLYQAKDKNKDQSYFLWTLTQKQLKHCLFPIGNYTKPEVRKLAKKFRLPNAEKKDSQGVCFLGQITLQDFLREYIPAQTGVIKATDGKVVGEHHGIFNYTIGQRKGLHLNVQAGKEHPGSPYYVASKDMATNTITVAEGENNKALYRKEVELTNVHFINPIHQLTTSTSIYARVRYRAPLAKANLSGKAGSGPAGQRAKLIFAVPQKFIAEGQSAVFYAKSGEMLGGGVIL
ncbi:MAG: tRNA 2-thiouridine(34) synthase MnmA [Patescibacteria group bacterium]